MIIPVRCFTCGKVVGSAYPEYEKRVKMGEDPKKILDDMGFERCRRWVREKLFPLLFDLR